MQGRALFTFIKGLEIEEYQLLIAMIGIDDGNADSHKVVKAIRKIDTYDEARFLRQTNLTKRRINTISRKIVHLAVGAVGIHDEEGLLHNALVTVRKLVFRMDAEPATSILTWAVRAAEKQERFEILFQLHELAELMRLPLDGLTKTEVIQKQINLAGYRALEHKLRRIPKADCSAEEREFILREVRNSPLMQSEDNANSVRSKAAFYKVMSGSLLFSGEFDRAYVPQERYVEFLQATEWLKRDREFFLAKEMIQLSKLLSLAGHLDLAQSIVFRVGNIESQSERAEQEKLKQLYPYRMIFAMQIGDTNMGAATLVRMNELLADKGRFDPLFRTENIYHGLYYCIASGDIAQGGLLAPKMRKFQSKEFHPRIYPMSKMLEIVLAFESGDLEDCSRLIKNLRKSKIYPSNKAFGLATGLLTRLVNQSATKHPGILRNFHTKVSELEESGAEQAFFHYFDLTAWIESKIDQCPMMEIFHHRTMNTSFKRTKKRVS